MAPGVRTWPGYRNVSCQGTDSLASCIPWNRRFTREFDQLSMWGLRVPKITMALLTEKKLDCILVLFFDCCGVEGNGSP